MGSLAGTGGVTSSLLFPQAGKGPTFAEAIVFPGAALHTFWCSGGPWEASVLAPFLGGRQLTPGAHGWWPPRGCDPGPALPGSAVRSELPSPNQRYL